MTFNDIAEILQSAANAVATAEGIEITFHRGRLSDISIRSVTSDTNLIYAEDIMRITPQGDVNTSEQWRIPLGFFRQDSTSSESMTANQQQADEDSRQEIFNITLTIARRFIDALNNDDNIELLNSPELIQVTRSLQGTFTGWATELQVRIPVGCEYNTNINDAIYRNSNHSFEQSIKRGDIYTAPDITVTDSDGSTFTQPANEDVLCTFTPGGSCDYDVYVNGVFDQSVTLVNCEDLTITVP